MADSMPVFDEIHRQVSQIYERFTVRPAKVILGPEEFIEFLREEHSLEFYTCPTLEQLVRDVRDQSPVKAYFMNLEIILSQRPGVEVVMPAGFWLTNSIYEQMPSKK